MVVAMTKPPQQYAALMPCRSGYRWVLVITEPSLPVRHSNGSFRSGYGWLWRVRDECVEL